MGGFTNQSVIIVAGSLHKPGAAPGCRLRAFLGSCLLTWLVLVAVIRSIKAYYILNKFYRLFHYKNKKKLNLILKFSRKALFDLTPIRVSLSLYNLVKLLSTYNPHECLGTREPKYILCISL